MHKICELILQISIIVLGAITSVYTLHMMFFATEDETSGDL